MNQSERRRFDAALIPVLQATMQLRSIPDSMLAGYWDTVKTYQLQEVLDALTRCLRECDRGQCTPAYLLRVVLAIRTTTAQQLLDKQHQAAGFTEPNTPYNLMRRLAMLAYSRKVVGQDWATVPPHPEGVPRYQGDFDYMPVVAATPRPDSKDLNSHRICWRQFDVLLKAEWANFNKINDLDNMPSDAL